MGDLNNNKKYEYVYVLLFIGICLFIVCRMNTISKYVFSKLKEEFIPVSTMNNGIEDLLLFEFIPVAQLEDINNLDVEWDLSYNDFATDDFLNNAFENNNMERIDMTKNDSYDNSGSDIVNDINGETSNVINDTSLATVTDSNMLADGEAAVTEVVSPNDINPIGYSMDELRNFDFLVTNCYAVDNSTSVNPDELNADNLLNMDMTVDTSGEDYKVLVYHTHGSETFADSRPGVIEDTVIGVGDELTRLLNEKGIKTYHDRGIYDTVDGVLDRSYAYTLSGNAVDSILAQYPSIEVVLDIHRDGVREDLRLVRVVDGKPTAQIMFLNGVSRLNINGDIDYLYNPNKIANLAFSLQMHLKGKALYGDLMRRIYIRGYSFNLEKMERASLVEVGAQTNTVEEAKNAMIPLSNIIYNVLSGQ